MAEKTSTVIIKVDLHCCACSKKIKKALCELEKQFKILSIVYDEKNNTVIVSGPFNPDCFIKKICCLAHKVIMDIQVKKPDPPKPIEKPDKPTPPPPTPPQQIEVVVNFPMCTVCCNRPCRCYVPLHSCRRGCSCGPVSDAPQCYGSSHCCESRGFKIVCEDEPSTVCSIM